MNIVCENCGATIAAKAIVCYRCGTPTAIPVAPRKPSPEASAGRPWLLVAILMVIAAVLGWFASGEALASTRQIVMAVVAAAALVLAGWMAVRPKR